MLKVSKHRNITVSLITVIYITEIQLFEIANKCIVFLCVKINARKHATLMKHESKAVLVLEFSLEKCAVNHYYNACA